MFKVGDTIRDKYNRVFVVVEIVQKTGANGELYLFYNLYPPTTKPKRAEERGRSLGLWYEPYLYIADYSLQKIVETTKEEAQQ